MKCPKCFCELELIVSTEKAAHPPLLGRPLLRFYIAHSGKKIKTIARELGIAPCRLSNMQNGRIGIGHKAALAFSGYFGHALYTEFIDNRETL